jgi:hypothetical protein
MEMPCRKGYETGVQVSDPIDIDLLIKAITSGDLAAAGSSLVTSYVHSRTPVHSSHCTESVTCLRRNLRGVLGWVICAPVLSALVYIIARLAAGYFLAKPIQEKSQ